MAKALTTTDHETIRAWVEKRGGCPAHVKGSGTNGDPGILRIDFPGYSGVQSLERISWDEFFEAFDANKLAFLYQDEKNSRFNKLVSRERAGLNGGARNGGRGRGRSKAKGRKKTAAKKSGPNAIELLTAQHRQVDELFEKIEAARSPAQRDKHFYRLADLLAAHTKIEETLFYPAVFTDETESELRESVEEHLAVKRIIADLLDMEADHPQFMSKVLLMKHLVQSHVEEEENELFPMVEELDIEDLDLLGARMNQRFRQLMKTEPHQVVPEETEEAALAF